MSPFQYDYNNNNHHWVIIDESSSIATNQRSNLPQPPLPIIKVPFPPNVDPEELILKPRKAKSKLPTKPPNAFMIYRMQYVKELHAKDYRLPMRSVSASVASAWREEPEQIVEFYEKIAREASKIYNEKYPKPTLQPRLSVEKHGQKRRNGLTNGTSTSLGHLNHLNDHAFNHNENTRPSHFRYFPGTTTLENHSLAHYHNHNMHSPPSSLAIPSLMTDYDNSGVFGRAQMRSPRTLSAPYSSTNSTNSLLPSNLHMQLPHVNSLSNAPLQSYMEEGATCPTGWDFVNTHN
ncbi:9487_t:CDS:1 [Funneliformis geosporum]|uniref:16612_t:CDS:1 n=1 Tax=Funneliformis geosporum TaxID=1117311 RepID=A0A9W4SG23_9GLOM|nr:16612_t:CDS:1 [Funneliformis geosporum]CAI2180146.1 9487_t:CDS:1 [Funneliformis geosporum]